MLAEAQTRIGVWHRSPAMLEPPLVKDGIALSMLKHDMGCGGGAVPVGFAEFIVPDVRPVDVFNTVMNVAGQANWNPKCDTMKFVGNWAEEGARGWDNVFNLIFNRKLEFLVWQVADVDFEREDFWMVTSTQNNSLLRAKSPKDKLWIESHNCLGAYHISKNGTGARVVITQHVSTPMNFFFPFHEILKVFPFAWKGMLDFIKALSQQSKSQRLLGWSDNQTQQPQWLLDGPLRPDGYDARIIMNATPVMVFSEELTTMPQTASQRQWLRIGATFAFVVLIMCCCCGCVCCIFKVFGKRRDLSPAGSECGSTCSGKTADLSDFDSECGDHDGCRMGVLEHQE